MNNQPSENIPLDDRPDNEKTDRPEVNVVYAVALAIGLALCIVLVGVIAFKNSDISTDTEVLESAANLEDLNYPDELTNDQMDDEITKIVDVINDLDANVSELDNQDLSDESLELTE